MTVSELIQLLSQFPADLPVRFVADDGYISTDDPAFSVVTTEDHHHHDPDRGASGAGENTLFIDLAG